MPELCNEVKITTTETQIPTELNLEVTAEVKSNQYTNQLKTNTENITLNPTDKSDLSINQDTVFPDPMSSELNQIELADYPMIKNPFYYCNSNQYSSLINLKSSSTLEIDENRNRLSRTYSTDNLNLLNNNLPMIPPIVRRLSSQSCKQDENQFMESFTPNAKGNPFDSLSIYKKSYLELPTHFTPLSLYQPPFKLPPTPLFPSNNYCDKQILTNSYYDQCSSHNEKLSSNESDKEISESRTNDLESNNNDQQNDGPKVKNLHKRKYPKNPKPNKPPPIPPLHNQTKTETNIKTKKSESTNGDGMQHDFNPSPFYGIN